MLSIHFYCYLLLIVSFNCIAMNTSQKYSHKNKNLILFSGFSRLPLSVIARIFTGTPHLTITAIRDENQKDIRQREAICKYSNPAIRNALFKVNGSFHRLFSWEYINPVMFSEQLRAEQRDIQSLLRRNIDKKYKMELKKHPSLQYTFFSTNIFIIGCNTSILLEDELHPLVEACISRCSQDVACYLKKDKKCRNFNNNKMKTLDVCLCAIIQNNDEHSLQLILENKYLYSIITTSFYHYISKFMQLGIYCGSTRIIKELMFLYRYFNITTTGDYIAGNFKEIEPKEQKQLFDIVLDNMAILRKQNRINLYNLLHCLAMCFNGSDLEKLGLSQKEMNLVSLKNSPIPIHKNKIKNCIIQ